MADETLVVTQPAAPGVTRVLIDRPRARNAQSAAMLYQLDDVFHQVLADDATRVVILAAAGPDFSAGHDLRNPLSGEPASRFQARGSWSGYDEPGGHGLIAREREMFFDLTRRWRDMAKPTIAQVQGRCIAGGLILAWACDLIVAAEDAVFSDPAVQMGVSGVEWFAHPWELGARKAKEMLFTAASWSAQEALQCGMVNHVVEPAELGSFTLDLAQRIARQPTFAVKLAKTAVNGAIDAQGQRAALDLAFQMHQLCHLHNRARFGTDADPAGLPALAKPSP